MIAYVFGSTERFLPTSGFFCARPLQPVNTHSVLVIEDNADVQSSVVGVLNELGLVAQCESSGRQGLYTALHNEFVLVILDLGLPDLGGLEVCRVLRQNKPAIPILILTAEESDLKRVAGFELGADDYVVKPFSPDVLRARIRSLLRRIDALQTAAAGAEDSKLSLRAGTLALDLRTRSVAVADTPLVLTPIEFSILALLVERAGHLVTRDQIHALVWESGRSSYEESIRSHVYRLRQKLESVDSGGPRIETCRGTGYRLVVQE